jgi:UDPglucose--hexose-1-phosphate uridylyltransferase
VKRTPIRLADGRRLIYFDRDESAVRNAVDRRSLAPSDGGSELRFDALREEWVIVASHRQNRTFQPQRDECPLCPTTAGHASEIPACDYDVVVFENRFPALRAVEQVPAEHDNLVRSGNGTCEVVAFTADHDATWTTLDAAKIDLVVDVWIDRTAELSRLEGVEQVFCFENRGSEIGVTLTHPHGQIYAYPYVTPRTARMLRTMAAHLERTGRNLADDVVAFERERGTRIVAASEHWTAFVPFAARWPYEVHIYPNRRVPDLAALPDAARADFGEIYLDVVRRFDRLFDKPAPYISAVHQAPVRVGRDLHALHVEVFTTRRAAGRLKYLAGSEAGMDAFSNDVPPEAAAERLRAAS